MAKQTVKEILEVMDRRAPLNVEWAVTLANEVKRLRTYIQSLDGKTLATRVEGDTFIDEGCIVAADILRG